MCASSGMIVYRYGMPAGPLTLEICDEQIWEIDLIANPDKRRDYDYESDTRSWRRNHACQTD